jgi:hypothetical protein
VFLDNREASVEREVIRGRDRRGVPGRFSQRAAQCVDQRRRVEVDGFGVGDDRDLLLACANVVERIRGWRTGGMDAIAAADSLARRRFWFHASRFADGNVPRETQTGPLEARAGVRYAHRGRLPDG